MTVHQLRRECDECGLLTPYDQLIEIAGTWCCQECFDDDAPTYEQSRADHPSNQGDG